MWRLCHTGGRAGGVKGPAQRADLTVKPPALDLSTGYPQDIHMFGSEKPNDIAWRRTENACKALSDRVDTLESANKRLLLEWEELYDKVRHQMSRMARRARIESQFEETTPDLSNGGGLPEGPDAISAKILARRNIGRHQP